jgi:predicted NAD-dependent protein-ADP-ribosyltransferase YbiA (DUF1768 family)
VPKSKHLSKKLYNFFMHTDMKRKASERESDADDDDEACEKLLRKLREDSKIEESEYNLMMKTLSRKPGNDSLIDMIMAATPTSSATTFSAAPTPCSSVIPLGSDPTHTATSKKNLSPAQFPVTSDDGIECRTALHYLQQSKVAYTDMNITEQREMRERIAKEGLQQANSLGRALSIDARRWDQAKADIMMDAYLLAYDELPHIREALNATNSIIVEDYLTDPFWGHQGGKGENMAGKLWMKVKEIKNIGNIIKS